MAGRGDGADYYTVPNAWERAAQRLEMLGATFDPGSIAFAREIGVGPGWRCLEAGAGGGSFARWLCATTSPGGRVVAVDADPRHLSDLPSLGGEVRQVDLVADDIGERVFDFVHTRLVLLHIPAREQVLTKLARAVSPGGWLAIEEHDVFGLADQMAGAYGEAWRAFVRFSQAGGVDAGWARTLPAQLVTLGFDDVTASAETPLFRGGSAAARLWSLTWTQAAGQMIAHGLSADTLAAAHHELEDTGRWFHLPLMVRVRGRRPR
ncbi:SAM-dependent methyltransferase [Mycobacterium sp. OAS707]|uniref:class I SAM-dependent methyltransferase n=1 Tax=Mycobacterium sp. OAS707 TaxID=2663822 RepID=UPI0017898ADA|nr:class I SAM-dependent methyltransferase [Mycobacterium sp. OAS707]MBE1550868.1 SAM-dependent methyltransferase [Mycobacterium sp. OAS707]